MPQNTKANQLPTFSGTIIPGEKVGRTIGFPTANVDVKIDPSTLEAGVYLAKCRFLSGSRPELLAQPFYGLAYFGQRHVFNELEYVFEVYLYDFSQEIYGLELAVELLQFMRAPFKLSSINELEAQLQKDKENGQEIIAKLLNDQT